MGEGQASPIAPVCRPQREREEGEGRRPLPATRGRAHSTRSSLGLVGDSTVRFSAEAGAPPTAAVSAPTSSGARPAALRRQDLPVDGLPTRQRYQLCQAQPALQVADRLAPVSGQRPKARPPPRTHAPWLCFSKKPRKAHPAPPAHSGEPQMPLFYSVLFCSILFFILFATSTF